jgi:glycosyltransferase involved in cell wall biosynthesis
MTQVPKKSILVVTTVFEKGGVTSYWLDIIRTLKHESFQWHIFSNPLPNSATHPFSEVPEVALHQGLIWHNPIESSRQLWRTCEQKKIDLVVYNGTLAMLRVLPTILALRFFSRTKQKCVFHNGAIYQTFIKDFINRIIVSFCGLFMNESIFVSQYVADYWLCHGAVVSRPFVIKRRSQQMIEQKIKNHSFVIGFLGRLSHEKDPELFVTASLRAKSILQSNSINLTIKVGGTGPLLESLQRISSDVQCDGWVNPSSWLDQIDLLVTSSKTEGWPIALVESLEHGSPVVGIDVGGVGEVLKFKSQTNGFLTKSRNHEELASLIVNFIQNYDANYALFFDTLLASKYTTHEWAMSITS